VTYDDTGIMTSSLGGGEWQGYYYYYYYYYYYCCCDCDKYSESF